MLHIAKCWLPNTVQENPISVYYKQCEGHVMLYAKLHFTKSWSRFVVPTSWGQSKVAAVSAPGAG